jgi:anti-sigma regulatory factor (Ser/Thr protein kinase)
LTRFSRQNGLGRSVSTSGSTTLSSGDSSSFLHEALLYQGPDEFGAVVLPLVRDGIAANSSILVAVDVEKAAVLRDELGADAARVRFVDMRDVGRNPARIIPVWRSFVAEHAARGALGVGEPVWPGRSAAELQECELHEALLNVAFSGGPAWRLVCPYDHLNLSASEVATAFDTHPIVPGFDPDPVKAESAGALERFRAALDEPSVEPFETVFATAESLRGLRQIVSARAREAGVSPDRADDLALAVSEVAANSVRYGGGGGCLRLWQDGETFVCEVRDHGHIEDPLVGRTAPEPVAEGQRGLWLVNQLCDLVQLRSLSDGVVVRLHTGLAGTRVA